MARDWMKKLASFDDAVAPEGNPFADVIRTPSPSANFTFGGGHGLPKGLSLLLFGPPKGGKSLMTYGIIGQLHKDDPEAICMKWDTEFRESIQLPAGREKVYGIDRKRYICYSTNSAEDVFDRIEKDVNAMCQDGAPIKLLVIDSISDIQGNRESTAESVSNVQIGDHAHTIQKGLKRILPIIRKHKIACILTTQVRSEMDPILQRKMGGLKAQASWAVKHFAEFQASVERDESKEGRVDLLDNEFVNKDLQDVRMDAGEATAHKIKFIMRETSTGVRGRQGKFTCAYGQGFINVHEEVFLLGVARNVIDHPNNVTYAFGDRKWQGKGAILKDLEKDTELQAAIIKELRRRDLEGAYATVEENEGIRIVDPSVE